MQKNKITLISSLLILAFLLSACQVKAPETNNSQENSNKNDIHHESAFYLHTEVTISTYGKLEQVLYDKIWAELDKIDHTLSMNLAEAELYKINAAAGKNAVVVSDSTFALINKAMEYHKQSPSFDITIGALVNLWGIGSDNPKVPTDDEIANALALLGAEDVVLNQAEKSVFLKRESMQIDLGAIAKGYAADHIRELLLENKVDSAILNFGGNVMTIGRKKDGNAWRVGVTTPDTNRNDYIGIVSISDKSIVTSGNYERFFEKDGKKYHHILDVNTGYPVENDLAAVSIISDSSTDCDAISTLVYALGLEKGLEFIENTAGFEALFVDKNNGVTISSGLKDNFRLTNPNFHLAAVDKQYITERVALESEANTETQTESVNLEEQSQTAESESETEVADDEPIEINKPASFVDKSFDDVKTALDEKNIDYKIIDHYVQNPSSKIISVDEAPLCLHRELALSKDLIYDLQEQLKVAGFFTSIDGSYGPNTKKTMLEFTTEFMSKNDKDFNSEVLTRLRDLNAYKFAVHPDNYQVLVNKKYNLKRHYQPADLTAITVAHSQNDLKLRAKVNEKLNQLFSAAMKDGIELRVVSAYRSFDYQNTLFNTYLAQSGFKEANKFSALAGQSEHQTGLAVDIDDKTAEHTLTADFELTPAFKWLKQNAADYGFILRFPKGKEKATGYTYKPWHFRYIDDVKAAKYIMNNNLSLEEYLKIN